MNSYQINSESRKKATEIVQCFKDRNQQILSILEDQVEELHDELVQAYEKIFELETEVTGLESQIEELNQELIDC